MPRLISRDRQIPNGFQWYESATGWKSRPWASFQEIVTSLIAHRKGNPALVEKNNLPTDYESVANSVDEYNALICQQLNWNDYISQSAGGQTAPFRNRSEPSLFGKIGSAAGGAKILVEWISSKEEAVPIDLAEHRAAICVKCPLNKKGDWTRFFTVPVSNAIRAELEKARGWNLRTSKDAELFVCEACTCPLPLKLHMRIDRIIKNLSPQQKAALDPSCWITAESK